MSSQNTSPLIGTALKSSNLNMSPDIGSIHSVERSTPELEPRENPEVVGHLKSLSGGGGPATCSSDDGMREDTGGATTVSLSAAETEVSNHHIDDSPPSPELNFSIQGTHHFFTQRFFPAYEYSLVLKGEVVNDRLRQKELARIALAKAKEDVRLREQWEAEEEERRKEEERRRKEEDEEAEQGEGQEDEPNSSPVARAPATPTPVVITKHQAATAAKKKR
ncbi:hypothetical protein DPEC_G00357320 [Dallia pectoralis]|uniref:Uncharacterized protein n=1 Tax=Dallia pectoralis TaxID=75939 RepID=A0ACC2EZY7_DALPE|nr:hypothetical protein DPEC_G00357320 [Dallia pectoralis]